MHESCPAWGGSTSVGTRPRGLAVEKSRSRATGASKMISFGLAHLGGSRVVMRFHHLGRSCGPTSPLSVAPTYSPMPRSAIDHPSTQLSSSPDEVGGAETEARGEGITVLPPWMRKSTGDAGATSPTY